MKIYKLNLNSQNIVFETAENLGTFLAEQVEANMDIGEEVEIGIKCDKMKQEDFNKLNEFEGIRLT